MLNRKQIQRKDNKRSKINLCHPNKKHPLKTSLIKFSSPMSAKMISQVKRKSKTIFMIMVMSTTMKKTPLPHWLGKANQRPKQIILILKQSAVKKSRSMSTIMNTMMRKNQSLKY